MTTSQAATRGALSDVSTPSGFVSWLFASGGMAFLLIGMLQALYGVALPAWSDTFGLAPGEGGTFLTLHGAGAFLAVLAGLFGLPILGLRLGLVLLAAGPSLIALGGSWPLTLAGGLVTGMGLGMLTAVVNRRFLSDFGAHGSGMVGLVNALSGLGAIASPLLFLVAGGQLGPLFWGIGAVAALTIALAPADPSPPPARGLPDLRQARVLILGFGLFAIAIEGALIGFGASALVDLGVSGAVAARLTSAFFVAFLLSRLSLYWLTRKVAPGLLVLAGLGGTAACAAVAALGAPAWGFVGAGLFAGATFPAFYVWAVGLLGSDPRMGSAILTLCLAGATLGPLTLRPLLAALGEGAVFGIVAVVGAALALVLAVVLRLVQRGGGVKPSRSGA